MPNTYTQIHFHLVFAVKHRQALIDPEWEEELFKYLRKVADNKGHKMLAINGTGDHIHILVGMRPDQDLSKLVQELKKSSTNLVNRKGWTSGKFAWQTGYGGFAHTRSEVGKVVNYINKQKERHRRVSFKEEYIRLLKKYRVPYKEEHLFEWLE